MLVLVWVLVLVLVLAQTRMGARMKSMGSESFSAAAFRLSRQAEGAQFAVSAADLSGWTQKILKRRINDFIHSFVWSQQREDARFVAW